MSDVERAYREALEDGRLAFQRCEECGNAWLPPRSECPRCLADRYSWQASRGDATVVSWAVYRRAVDPAFEDRVPYNVALVVLDEGPRMMTNIVGLDEVDALEPDMRVRLSVERGRDDQPLARFRPAS
jgi:uncharacterized OB-fold protein